MKKLGLLCLCMMFFFNSFSQKLSTSDVPAGVLKSYKMKIADSLPTSWEKTDKFYTARFKKNDLKASMVFSESSEWIWTRWEVSSEYLPKKIKEYITANYPKYKIIKTNIEYKTGGEFYLIGLKLKKDKPTLRFTIKSDFVSVEPAAPSKNTNSKP